jgi:RNA polymerase sigma factor (sigma-70 family)
VSHSTDEQLVRRSRLGDRDAFAELVARHTPRATSAARTILRSPEDAEDVAQEAILSAFLSLDRLRDGARFGSWLAAIAANLAKMRLRQRRSAADLPGGLAAPADDVVEALDSLRSALAVLPAGEREVVVMHYVEGLSCEEIGTRIGRSAGAVRVRLHRARLRLRERLTHRKERGGMVEVTLEDVVVRVLAPAEGEELPRLADERLRVVVLKERDGERRLPIWIGAFEGDALALHLGGESMPRPLTADLMARLLEAAGGRIEDVRISSLRDKTFYAIVRVVGPAGAQELDARPSDALNLAARVGAPIFVDDEVMEQAGRTGELLDEELTSMQAEWLEVDQEGEWTSLSPALVKSLYPALTPK